MINVRDLCFSYGEKRVLSDISFSASDGEIVSLLGPNGAGKTTLLKCLCNLLKPESGTIEIDGENVSTITPREFAKKISYVPQKTMPSRVTVFDSVLIGRRPHIDWTATRRDFKVVWDAMRVMSLEDMSLDYVDEISGGEFQKTQIARAIAQEPMLMVLDEPTNNLDISNQHITMHIVEDIVRESGMCAIMTMHDINLALHYSDKFLFMKDGKVHSYGGKEIITEELMEKVYGVEVDVIDHKGTPLVVPCKFEKGYLRKKHESDHAHPHPVEDHVHERVG